VHAIRDRGVRRAILIRVNIPIRDYYCRSLKDKLTVENVKNLRMI